MNDCDCTLTVRNVVYVGKAVSLRNRLQAEFFNSLSRVIPEWVDLYMQPPHNHILFASDDNRKDLAGKASELLEEDLK